MQQASQDTSEQDFQILRFVAFFPIFQQILTLPV